MRVAEFDSVPLCPVSHCTPPSLAQPPSLSLGGLMRLGGKAPLIHILEQLIIPSPSWPYWHISLTSLGYNNFDGAGSFVEFPHKCDGIILDGGGIIHAEIPRVETKTFSNYVSQLLGKIEPWAQSVGAKRVDIAWDQYLPHSLKSATRIGRGVGVRRVNLPEKGKTRKNSYKDCCITLIFNKL